MTGFLLNRIVRLLSTEADSPFAMILSEQSGLARAAHGQPLPCDRPR